MKIQSQNGKWKIIGMVALATLIFAVSRSVKSILGVGDMLAEQGWSMVPIIAAFTVVGMVSTGIAVLLLLPLILRTGKPREWLSRYLRADVKAMLLGILSFVVFGLLGAGIALSMGIYAGDWSIVFARPDIRPDPDVVGWGYFLLALVPGIWEELAFRGLVLTRLQERFSPRLSILLSATFFALFHVILLLTESVGTAIGGVIMAFFFGLAWGVMTLRTGSIVPAMISHYLVDAAGQMFLNVSSTDPAQTTMFFLLLTVGYPLVMIPLTAFLYHQRSRSMPVKIG